MTTVIPDFEEDKVNITFKDSFSRDLITELKKMNGINIKEELIRWILDEIKNDLENDNGKLESFIWEHWD